MIYLSGYLFGYFTFDSMNHVHMILTSVKAAFSIISPNILIMMMIAHFVLRFCERQHVA